jgi:hypothetical protein
VNAFHRTLKRFSVQQIAWDHLDPGSDTTPQKFRSPNNASHRILFSFKSPEKTPTNIAGGTRKKNRWFHGLFISFSQISGLPFKGIMISG